MSPNQPSDGTLVVVVDQIVEDDFWLKANERKQILFSATEDQRFVAIDAPTIYQLADARYCQATFGENSPRTKECQENADWALAYARLKLPHSEIYQIITEGKIQIALLLETSGGKALMLDRFRRLKNLSELGEASFATLVGRYADSLGALLFMEAEKDQRFLASEKSEVTFHLSPQSLGEDSISKWKINVDWPMIKALLLENVEEDKKAQLEQMFEAALNDQTKPDRQILFSGAQARDLGLAKIANEVSGSGGLRELFEKNYGVALEAYKATLIGEFFEKIEG